MQLCLHFRGLRVISTPQSFFCLRHGFSFRHLLLLSEPNAGEFEAFRLNLQQQMVHRHIHYPLPQQERSVRGEDQEIPSHHMFPRVYR